MAKKKNLRIRNSTAEFLIFPGRPGKTASKCVLRRTIDCGRISVAMTIVYPLIFWIRWQSSQFTWSNNLNRIKRLNRLSGSGIMAVNERNP